MPENEKTTIPEVTASSNEVYQACGSTVMRAANQPVMEVGDDLDLPPPREANEMAHVDSKSKIVMRAGRRYVVTPVVPISTQAQIEHIIDNLKSGMPTPEQKEAVEKYVRPSLEKFGI